jgi:hypothetical protein
MKYTPNYGLKKPEQDDFYNVEDFNENADIIDEKLKEAEAAAEAVQAALNAHLADNEQQFLDVNLNIIDMAVELETLKGATLNGVTANIFIETFQNLNDINLTHGIYESENKRLVL